MRWLAVLFTVAACSGGGTMCTDTLQVCIIQHPMGNCTYATPACCNGQWACSTGTIESAPGLCIVDDTATESCG